MTCHFENGPFAGKIRILPNDELPLGVRVEETPPLALVRASIGAAPANAAHRAYEYRLWRLDPVLPTVGYYRLWIVAPLRAG